MPHLGNGKALQISLVADDCRVGNKRKTEENNEKSLLCQCVKTTRREEKKSEILITI